MDLNVLRETSENTDILSEEIFNKLNEFVNYNSTGMRVTVTEILGIFRKRVEKGENITFFKTGKKLDMESFKPAVLDAFGEEIFEDVFGIELD